MAQVPHGGGFVAPINERNFQGFTRLIEAQTNTIAPPAPVRMLESHVVYPRVVRLTHTDPLGNGKTLAQATISVFVDGARVDRVVPVWPWGVCVGVPGGGVTVDCQRIAVSVDWEATIAPGLPVIERIGVIAPQVASTQQPPAFARLVTIISFGAVLPVITLQSGIVVPLVSGVPVTVVAQPISVGPAPATETELIWEVYQ